MTITRYAGRSSARCGVKSRPQTEHLLSTLRKARNSLPSPQRGQRPRKPRLIEPQTSRFSPMVVSRVQTLVAVLTVSMTCPFQTCSCRTCLASTYLCRPCACPACDPSCAGCGPDGLLLARQSAGAGHRRGRVALGAARPCLPTAAQSATRLQLGPLLPDER